MAAMKRGALIIFEGIDRYDDKPLCGEPFQNPASSKEQTAISENLPIYIALTKVNMM